jgi:hypothetical protein
MLKKTSWKGVLYHFVIMDQFLHFFVSYSSVLVPIFCTTLFFLKKDVILISTYILPPSTKGC